MDEWLGTPPAVVHWEKESDDSVGGVLSSLTKGWVQEGVGWVLSVGSCNIMDWLNENCC